MSVLVDSDVILDVVKQDSQWKDWSRNALGRCANEGALVINPVIYAEVSIEFATTEEVSKAIPPEDYEYRAIPWDAAFLAGKCFVKYRRRKGTKQSPLPDFFIGAHAAVEKMALLTRDPKRYRSSFPTVELICPDSL